MTRCLNMIRFILASASRLLVICLFIFGTSYHATDAVPITSAEVSMANTTVWLGEPVLMTCSATPDDTTIVTIMWARRDRSGTFVNIYYYSATKMLPGPAAHGHMVGWMSSTPGQHNLYINHTNVFDQCAYFCTIRDDQETDKESNSVALTVNVRQHDHKITVGTQTYTTCEDAKEELDDSSAGSNVEVICSVTSRPKSALTWTSSQPDRSGGLLTLLATRCGDSRSHVEQFTCTRTIKMKKELFEQAQINMTCRGEITGDTSHACVNVVLTDFVKTHSHVASVMCNNNSRMCNNTQVLALTKYGRHGPADVDVNCTVTSRPFSLITWTSTPVDTSGRLLTELNKICVQVSGVGVFKCTNIVRVDISILTHSRTTVNCRARRNDSRQTNESSVQLVMTDFARLFNISIELDAGTSYTLCEDVNVNKTKQNVIVLCEVISRPQPRISWSVGTTSETGKTNCITLDRDVYKCTSNVTVALPTQRTKVKCNALYGENLTASACVVFPGDDADVGSTLTFSIALVAFAAVVTSCSLRR